MQGSASLLQAASGASRSGLTGTVSVDLLRNGTFTDISAYCSSWTVDRSLTTDVPQGSRLVTGYAASQLTLTAIGNPQDNVKDAPWMWSPYNPASGTALYGAAARVETPITVLEGMTNASGSEETVPSFTGYIRAFDIDSAGGTATITALDGSDRMRSQCNIPQIIGDYVRSNYTGGIVRQGLTGGRALDYLFRANGLYSTPAPRPGCRLSVTGHGSLEPEYVTDASGNYVQYGSTLYAWDGPFVGSGGNSGSSVVSYIQDIQDDIRTGTPKMFFGQCPDPQLGITAAWSLKSPITFGSGHSATIEAWVDLSNPLDVASGSQLMAMNLDVKQTSGGSITPLIVGFMGDGRPFIQNGAGSPVVGNAPNTSTQTWIYVLITIAAATSSAVASFTFNATAPTVANGRVLTAATSYTSSAGYTISEFDMLGDQGCRARFEALQVTSETSPASNYGYTPTAVIEPSLNNLIVVPFSPDKQDSWTVAQEIAACEFGTLFFSESGIATFWNRNHFQDSQTSAVASVTSLRGLEQLTSTEAVDSVKNHIIATATPYQVQAPAWVYQLSSTLPGGGVHSNSTVTYTAQFDNAAATVSTSVAFIPLGGFSTPQSGYRACRTPDGSGDQVSNLAITVVPYAQSAKISVHNPNSYPVYLVGPANDLSGNAYPPGNVGVPMLQLWGSPIIQAVASSLSTGSDPTTTSTYDAWDYQSVDFYGEQQYALTSSSYLQDSTSLQSTINDMVAQIAYAFPVLSNVSISAIPGLQIGDRIKLLDPVGTLIANDFFVMGISRTMDPTSGYLMTLTLKPLAGPGALIWDDPTAGTWDNFVWDGTY